MFSHALTADELFLNLPVKTDLESLKKELGELVIAQKISERDGLFFLPGRENILAFKEENKKAGERKMQRALFIAKIFRFIPWVKMIAIANVMGEGNFKEESDIDLFIVTKKKKIWLTRFFTVLTTDLLRWRPKVNDTKDKICLSFFVTKDNLNVEKLLLDSEKPEIPAISRDPYFVYWLANLLPIYDHGLCEKMIQENSWFSQELPNWRAKKIQSVRRSRSSMLAIINLVFGSFERVTKKIQLKIIPQKIKDLDHKGTEVVISDQILKFHTNDRRIMYKNRLFLDK